MLKNRKNFGPSQTTVDTQIGSTKRAISTYDIDKTETHCGSSDSRGHWTILDNQFDQK